MHITAKKECFNRAYVSAIAAQAGINSSVPVVDNDSVDITFIGKDFSGIIRDPQVSFQLKCTHKDLRVEDSIRFPLSRKNYDDLRETRLSIPRYLAVLEVPESCDEWIEYLDTEILLRSNCYWASIRGFPQVPQDWITVGVPISQRLTGESLLALLTHASNRTYA